MRLVVNLLLNFDRILLCLMGIVWALQGLGLLPGELMHGHIFWSFAGAVQTILGEP